VRACHIRWHVATVGLDARNGALVTLLQERREDDLVRYACLRFPVQEAARSGVNTPDAGLPILLYPFVPGVYLVVLVSGIDLCGKWLGRPALPRNAAALLFECVISLC
jgi:hypothetical protein